MCCFRLRLLLEVKEISSHAPKTASWYFLVVSFAAVFWERGIPKMAAKETNLSGALSKISNKHPRYILKSYLLSSKTIYVSLLTFINHSVSPIHRCSPTVLPHSVNRGKVVRYTSLIRSQLRSTLCFVVHNLIPYLVT